MLGREELLDDAGRPIVCKTKHVFLLLVVLLSDQDGFDRMELASLIWPDAAPEAARKSLRNALSHLRGALPPGAIQSSNERVALELPVDCDWLMYETHRDYSGDFMPSYSQEWVIDQRLRLRTIASESALKEAAEAWENREVEKALTLADRAGQIDPWDQDAMAARIRYLEESGERLKALILADNYRSKVVRSLGVIAEIDDKKPTSHLPPIVESAEWLLARNPAEAIALLAATNAEWMTMPVQLGLEIHMRALEANPQDSATRRLAFAQTLNLLVLAGRLGSYAEKGEVAFAEALKAGESVVAARIAGALAYGNLSKGDFKKAQYFATSALSTAKATGNPGLEAEFQTLCAIILQHVGKPERSRQLLEENLARVEEHGSLQDIGGLLLVLSDPLIQAGELDRAAQYLERARRIFESCGGMRAMLWVEFGDALLQIGLGDLYAARDILARISAEDTDLGGHAVRAMADDYIANVDCKLGEYEAAAESLARAAVFRKGLGTVPSVVERINIRSTHRVLAERLGERDLRAALRRGARVPSPRL